MSTTQQTLARYFPTRPWLEKYGSALEANDELAESGEGWGVDWDGAMVFEITDVPLEGRTVGDLPEELREEITDTVRSLSDDRLAELLEAAPEDVRSDVDARNGPLEERVLAELQETELRAAPDRLWPELEAELPELISSLLAQLDENLSEDGTVYAWLDVYDGGCRGVDVLDSRSERDHGFVITGGYESWRDLVTGDGDVINMIMSGEVELEGDMQKLLQYTEAATDLVDTAGELDSRFIL